MKHMVKIAGKWLTWLPLMLAIILACSEEMPQIPNDSASKGWLVDELDLVINEGAHDRIRSIDEPQFEKAIEGLWAPEEQVYLVRQQEDVFLYPIEILWNHEIVNAGDSRNPYTVSYCPLTGSGIAWSRIIGGDTTTFGVSGHLYKSNLVPYDRRTGSYWSQMLLSGIRGELGGESLDADCLLLTTYGTALQLYPEALVLMATVLLGKEQTSENKTDRGEIGWSPEFMKNHAFGVVEGNSASIFRYALLDENVGLQRGRVGGKGFVVVGSNNLGFIVAFSTTHPEDFSALTGQFPDIMQDVDGNVYDWTGVVTAGPLQGQRLAMPFAYSAKHFAWKLFFPDVQY